MNSGRRRAWPLHAHLGSLLAATAVLTFLIVGAVFLLLRIPQLETQIRSDADNDARELAFRIEAQMGAVHAHLALLAAALDAAPPAAADVLLDNAIGGGKTFGAIYLVEASGRVAAAGLSATHRHLRAELLGSDLAETPIVQAVKNRKSPVWGDKYLSPLTGSVTIGFALPIAKDRMLLAEMPLSYLLIAVRPRTGAEDRAVWIVDRRGELLADTESESRVGSVNLYTSPLLQAALAGQPLPPKFDYGGRRYYVGGTRSPDLGWFFIARVPAGLNHPEIRMTVMIVVVGFTTSLVLGSLFAFLWARRLLRPLAEIVRMAHQVSEGQHLEDWPRGLIAEFNDLSADIGKMASAMAERERKAVSIFNASPVPLLISRISDDSRVVDVNQAWVRQFKRKPEDVVGRTGVEFDLWDSTRERDAVLGEAVQGNASREARLRCADGELLECRISVRSIDFADERFLIWAMEDITEIRRAEVALREMNAELERRVKQRTESLELSNASLTAAMADLDETRHELARKGALLEATIENISQGISMFDGDLKLLVHNRKFLDLLSFPESLGRPGTDLAELFRFNAERGEYGPGEIETLVEQRLALARHPTPHRFRRERPDGSVIEVQGTPLPPAIGGFVTTYADVTDLVRAKEHAERTLAELKIAQQQLVQAEKMAALGNLVAGVAHELNTPLGNALCVVSTLEEDYVRLSEDISAGRLRRSVFDDFLSKDEQGLRLLRNSVERAAGLVSKFKQVAVNQTNEIRRRFELADSVESTLSTLAPQFADGPVRVEKELTPGIAMEGYPGPLERVLGNLILNARVHAYPEGRAGRVRVSARRTAFGGDGDWVELICEDDGCGMPEEMLPRIFDPFFTTRLGQGGSGLGLHIVHNIVTALLGGRIEVRSRPHEGTRFTIFLPAIAPDHRASPARRSIVDERPAGTDGVKQQP